ncbi:hypothetical protein MLD38_009344 [Melastoma candidum]|uniref:Uncharacterized protein n=1 Tax=Melastoma candidum TaxID=119954 RepID=A0ACB9RYN0_9MYRT|nr:hypothetical protein MLD38_009344 [Melastoma candidum]
MRASPPPLPNAKHPRFATMASNPSVLPFLILLSLASIVSASLPVTSPRPQPIDKLSRKSFPPHFMFGAGSSAHQVEGAYNIDGKGMSSWDNFTATFPDRISNSSNGKVATDFYHRYKEDIQLMKDTNLDAFRFSISWTRVIPTGKYQGGKGVNPLGIKYYNDLINSLIAGGITPFVVIFHWDPPQALQDEYGGLLSSKFIADYVDFARLCFKEFGDRVKFWTTFNEPWSYSVYGYDLGQFAPGRCSPFVNSACVGGNSSTEPYQITHNLLLSHAAAVRLYKTEFQPTQKGQIGMTNICFWNEPYSNSTADQEAAQRGFDFMCGWLMHPITYGDYPQSMKTLVGNRLPKFTPTQSQSLKGSYDFYGVNYYTGWFVQNAAPASPDRLRYYTDPNVDYTYERNGVYIGSPTFLDILYVYPEGMRKLMNYLKANYNNPPIYITENGICEINQPIPLKDSLNDTWRINWLSVHLNMLSKIIKEDKVDVRGYFPWSFMDDFEWSSGYTERFGLHFVDFVHNLTRYPKESAKYYASILAK